MQIRAHVKYSLLILSVIVGCFVLAQQPQAASTTEKSIGDTPTTTAEPTPGLTPEPSFSIKLGENNYIDLSNGAVDTNSSKCDANSTNPKLVVKFDCGQVELEMSKSDKEIFIKAINGLYKFDATTTTFSNASKMFVTSETGHYYKCNSEQSVVVHPTSGLVNQTVSLLISDFAYEAFRNASGTDFYKIVEECDLDSEPFSDGVRIGVGICLVAFVAIILIAYFVGRRRWLQRSSYESV